MSRVLHIVPHLGGGVGTVLRNYLDWSARNSSFVHELLALESLNQESKIFFARTSVSHSENCHDLNELIEAKISVADIVLIHWWNHPALFNLFVKVKWPKCRLVFWSHVSGFSSPQEIHSNLINFCDHFVLTTPTSRDLEVFKTFPIDKLSDIWSVGDLSSFRSIVKSESRGFRVGYIGTMDYAKLHPDFLEIFSKNDVPQEIQFFLYGGNDHERIKEDICRRGLASQIHVMGPTKCPEAQLKDMDVFLYPLNPRHYGTCDQALAEAMSAGVVPVVLNNRMESFMVEDQESGLVATSLSQMYSHLMILWQQKELRQRLAEGARRRAEHKFSFEKMSIRWEQLFQKLALFPKENRQWHMESEKDLSYGARLFLQAVPELRSLLLRFEAREIEQFVFKNREHSSKTKGTVHHYLSYFPEDEILQKWARSLTI